RSSDLSPDRAPPRPTGWLEWPWSGPVADRGHAEVPEGAEPRRIDAEQCAVPGCRDRSDGWCADRCRCVRGAGAGGAALAEGGEHVRAGTERHHALAHCHAASPEPSETETEAPEPIPHAGEEVRVGPQDTVPYYDLDQSFDHPPHVADMQVTDIEWD